VPSRFARYCEKVANTLGDLIHAACTINEANIGSMISQSGYLPPIDQLRQAPWWSALANATQADPNQMMPFMFASGEKSRQTIISAHKLGLQALKSGLGNFPVGITLALTDVQSIPGGEALAANARYEMNDSWLEAVRGDDFVGVQTYTRQRYCPDGPLPPEDGVELTQMGYEFWPEALEATIRAAIKISGLPVIVTENGIGCEDDTRRIEYVNRALKGVVRCLQEGLDVRGYTYWSALDNFEWMLGYTPTFGLVAVDRQTQVRTPKPSARWLGTIARENRF
jgi:beta-glucosidase